jgi:predicted MFS family arabinose efflux permease
MHAFLLALAASSFTSNLSTRALDPLLPHMATELMRPFSDVALFTSAYAFSFAFAQPLLGTCGDTFGKARLITICLAIVAMASIAGSYATSYEALLVSRIVCGFGAGGIVPLGISLIGDLYPMNQRQVALSRLTAGSSCGFLLGATLSGVIGEYFGWRTVLVTMGSFTFICIGLMLWTFRNQTETSNRTFSFSQLLTTYRGIFMHPIARLLLVIVFVEGIAVHGFFPFIAALLIELGQPRPSMAGIIIAGFPIGIILYTIFVRRLLAKLGTQGMMRVGCVLVALPMIAIGFGLPWQLYAPALMLMGLGFFMVHGLAQTLMTEVMPHARATAISLEAIFLFLGQAAGPAIYGFNFSVLGTAGTMTLNAVAMLLVGFVGSALLLRQKPL